jgi:site-specific recombinase XerD
MGTLREQMESDLVVRGMSERTREAYVGAVAKLAKYYGRSPDRVSEQEVQNYLLHLIQERKLSWSSCNIAAQGIRFFYRITLKRSEAQFLVPTARQPQKLPQILSREEVASLIEKTLNLKHRAILMSAYGAGLRLTEICHLKVSDVDSKRMTIRVEQGKGAKDRYTLLSPTLLGELRRYWCVYRPKLWLSAPGIRADRSASIRSTVSTTAPRHARASPSPAGSIRCATPSPRICSRAGPISTPSSG